MSHRARLLWIEDETQHEVQNYLGPLYTSFQFKTTIAHDASEGLAQLQRGFDLVIVDIRIPPGKDPALQRIYNAHGADPSAAKLGLLILRFLFGRLPASMSLAYSLSEYLERCSMHQFDPSQFGVFSVEADELAGELEALGVTHRQAKRAHLPSQALVSFARQILADRRPGQT